MELKHSFTVPAPLEETWQAFGDLASVAECFPGATVTEADGETFTGNAKVKLGPVAMLYSGQGQILERDDATHTMRLEAKGKDKRGNGTAGATVSMAFSAEGEASSTVEVTTDLSVTGKPAQFGARMMQEVSDKLLGQFVDCLQQRVGSSGGGAESAEADPAAATPDSAEGSQATTPPVVSPSGGPGPSTPTPAASGPAPGADSASASAPGAGSANGVHRAGGAPVSGGKPPAGADDALDLGSTVLPVLLKMYSKQIAAGLGLLALLAWLVRRRG